jgi:hypothetical protein
VATAPDISLVISSFLLLRIFCCCCLLFSLIISAVVIGNFLLSLLISSSTGCGVVSFESLDNFDKDVGVSATIGKLYYYVRMRGSFINLRLSVS